MGEDFSAADPLEIVFGVNDTMACAMVSIIDDDALEGDHSFSVQIVSTVPPITIDNTPVEVTITDNEGILSKPFWRMYIYCIYHLHRGVLTQIYSNYIHAIYTTLRL